MTLRSERVMFSQEGKNALVERVVAIARDHVSGSGHIENFGLRNPLQHVGDAFVIDDIAVPAPHQKSGHRHRAAHLFQLAQS